MDQNTVVLSANEYKSRQITESKQQAAEAQSDFVPDGGKYLVGGQWLDANGEPTSAPKGAGDAVKQAEQAQKEAAEAEAAAEQQRVASGAYGRDVTAEAEADAEAAKAARRTRER